jgi:divalent metal cation (Fe/Co/Zn/Cd) transporter
MKPIWYFVGLILLVVGGLIFLTGLYLLVSQSETRSVLGNLYPNIWWGAIMVVVGLIFILKNKNVKVE